MFSVKKSTLACRNPDLSPFALAMVVLCIATMGACAAGAQQAKVGWVLDLSGQWAVSGTTTLLAPATPVPSAGRLVDLSPKDGDYIRIADLHGDLIKSIRCSKSGCGQCGKTQDNCNASIEPLPNAPEQPGLLTATWEGLMDLFAGQPERYSVHRSRSLLADTCLADGVVPLDTEGNAHLDGLLKNCVAGDYSFEFIHADSGTTDHAERELSVSWNPNQPVGSAVPSLPAGLFRARFTRGLQSGSAWILVAASPAFEDDQARFQKLSAIADGWGPQVGRDTKVAYMRACLDALSRSKGGPNRLR